MAYLITRIPFLTFPRVKSWNEQFPPHPEPVYVDSHLIQRVLHMRTFYWLAIVFALIPLTFGWVSLGHGSALFGFGMWSVAGWLVLSRVTAFISGEEAPATKQLAMRLQNVKNISDSEESCCPFAQPMWELSQSKSDCWPDKSNHQWSSSRFPLEGSFLKSGLFLGSRPKELMLSVLRYLRLMPNPTLGRS